MNQNEFCNQKREAVEKMMQMHKKVSPKTEGSAKKTEPSNKQPIKITNNKNFLDSFFENGDLTVIIGLLLLLMSEKADKRLLFALVYILL